jgi:hypothetical protein
MSDFRDEFTPNEAKMTRELRDVLDSAVRDEPPLFLDPAQIVAAGEIRTWRRRLGASVVLTALAAVAVIATAIPLAARHGSGSHPADATSKATHTPVPVPASPAPSGPAPPRTTYPNLASPVPADPRIAAQLTDVLRKLLPLQDSRFRPAPMGTKAMVFVVTDGTYQAGGDIVDKLGYGHLFVSIGSNDQLPFGCDTRDPGCFSTTGPYGAAVTIHTSVQSAGGHDWMVIADRADGVEVTVQVSDYTLAAAAKGSAPSQRDVPPLTVSQMIELATAPALRP